VDRIIHKIEGPATSAVNVFQEEDSERSCQYVVDHDGTVYQCTRELQVAWQAGYWPWNRSSIGIEHAGYTERDDVTEEEYRASARLVEHLCYRYSIPIDRTGIKGHYQVPGCEWDGGGFGCHTDPGPVCRWLSRILRLATAELLFCGPGPRGGNLIGPFHYP
jgi:N-acetyl-anhydromuramyl-L-alanine amidase AmpD